MCYIMIDMRSTMIGTLVAALLNLARGITAYALALLISMHTLRNGQRKPRTEYHNHRASPRRERWSRPNRADIWRGPRSRLQNSQGRDLCIRRWDLVGAADGCAEPLTDIDQGGKWQTVTHLGSTYAALLVKPAYRPPATMGGIPKVGPEVLAVETLSPDESKPAAQNGGLENLIGAYAVMSSNRVFSTLQCHHRHQFQVDFAGKCETGRRWDGR